MHTFYNFFSAIIFKKFSAGSTLSILNYLIEGVAFVGVGWTLFQNIIIEEVGGSIKGHAYSFLILIRTKTRSSMTNTVAVFLGSYNHRYRF